MYGRAVEERVRAVRFEGELEKETIRVEKTNPICGDLMRVSLYVENGIVCAARWKAHGCPPALAAADLLVEEIQGKRIEELKAITAEKLFARLEGLPATSRHAVSLAMAVLTEAMHRLASNP